jgi:alpha-L-fucosidase 2
MEEGRRAHDLVRFLVTPDRLAPNMFDLHPPFQIDGNFGATSGIAEMLLHSHNGELHVLPALPPAWPAGSVTGLRGRGGYTVGAAWEGGQVRELTVTPDRAGTVRIRSRVFTGTHELRDATSGALVQPARPEADLVEFAGLAGHTYRAAGQ